MIEDQTVPLHGYAPLFITSAGREDHDEFSRRTHSTLRNSEGQALADILTADKRARTWKKGPYGNFGQSSVF